MVVPTNADASPHPLDQRLVRVALELLADEGIERLTLRRIARRAGVSHGAPLRHYRSLADLLGEVAAHGFRLLSETVEQASARLPAGAGPVARLAAAGRGYVTLAVENPALFALMFRPEALDLQNPSYARESGAAFQHLLVHVRAAQDAGWNAERDTDVLAGCVWAGVHGLATLWAQGAFRGPLPHASLDDMISITLELVLEYR